MCRLLQVGVVLLGCLVVLAGGCGDDKDPVSPKNTPPTACFLVEPLSGTTETLFEMDASCSTGNEDPSDSLQVRWDWEDDGEWNTEWTTTKTATHQYAIPGTKTIRLQVRDTGGLRDETTRSVTVSDGPTPAAGFVLIPPGTFTMGSPEDEPGRSPGEGPQHQVTLTRGFLMSKYEVTEEWWYQVMGGDPTTSQLSKTGVSWDMAVEFCNALSQLEGLTPAYEIHGPNGNVTWDQNVDGYRLPTEAEWEYACRAGSTTAFSNGPITHTECEPLDPYLDAMGWYCGNRTWEEGPAEVGQKRANQWGLYDMHGNVWEWVWCGWRAYASTPQEDPVTSPEPGAYRVFRGGHWYDVAQGCRSACRTGDHPDYEYDSFGFRPVRSAL